MPSEATNFTPHLLAAIAVLVGAIVALFKMYTGRTDVMDKERAAVADKHAGERTTWAIERTKLESRLDAESEALRAEYEAKYKDLVASHAQELRRLYEEARTHEDSVRREFGDIMDAVSTEAGKQSAALTDVLNKFYDRFVGPRARGR